ncbi:MAG: HipA domain-containing protein [Thiolinea sp.]
MLQVLYSNQKVGRLWSKEHELCLQYDAEWLNSANAFPLTPHLALQTAPWYGDPVLFFFSNLLPEGTVLDTILKLRRLPRGNLYAQLAEFGEDAAGAFSIVPEGDVQQRQPAYQAYPVETIRADIARLRNHIPLLFQHGELRLSLAGAQDKIPVHYSNEVFHLPVGGAASTHILKPPIQPEQLFPEAVLNEAFCLKLAKHCGLDTVTADIVYLPEPILLVERYDRLHANGQIRRLHQLDFCQLAGLLPSQKYTRMAVPISPYCFS